MSKFLRLSRPLFGLAVLSVSAFADTVTLKTGERIEAKVLSETATEMTLETQISAGIKDERVVKKADIVKIDRVAPDEAAYRSVMNLQPGKNSLLPAQYDAVMNALQSYATQYPESAHTPDVKQAQAAFQVDKKRVEAGEMKLDGFWLSKAQVAQQRVQIGGLQAFNAMKNANAAGDAIGALNAFVTVEKGFPGAKVLPDAIELARQILPALKPATERALENQKIKEIERETGVKMALALDRPELIAANQREQAKADAALAAANAAGLWPPMAANSDKCLKAILAKIPAEIARLEKLPVADMRESVRLAEQAQVEFTDKNLAAATETLKDVTKLWPANEIGKRLTAQIAALKNPPKPEPAAAPLVIPPPATGVAVPGAATPAPKLPVATPAPVKPAATPAAPVATTPLAAAVADDESVAPKPAEEPPKAFFMTVPGAITIVVALALLLAGANIFSKIRQRSKSAQE